MASRLDHNLRVGAGRRVRPSNLMPTCIAGRHGSLPLQDLTYIQNAGKRQFKNSGVGLAALKLNQCVLTYAMGLPQNCTAS